MDVFDEEIMNMRPDMGHGSLHSYPQPSLEPSFSYDTRLNVQASNTPQPGLPVLGKRLSYSLDLSLQSQELLPVLDKFSHPSLTTLPCH